MSSAKRKPLPKKTPTEVKLDHIIGKMLKVAWSAQEKRACARKWGLSEVHVENLASEASRYIRRSQRENAEDVKERLLASVEVIVATAVQKGQLVAALKGLDMLARAHSLYAPEKLELSGDLANMSESALEAKRAAIIERIAKGEPDAKKLQ